MRCDLCTVGSGNRLVAAENRPWGEEEVLVFGQESNRTPGAR